MSPRTSATCVSRSVTLSYANTRNWPYRVGRSASPTRRTMRSVPIRYLMRSAMVIRRIPWRFAKRASCGTRAMDPSSFMISQITPAGYSPAMRARSTAASVWPARTRTPPSRARSGNMWPGRDRSPGVVAGSMAAATVAARSAAEMPVLVRCLASIDTQNAVSNRAVFCVTISGTSSWSRRAPVIGMQMRPRPWRAMKLITSGVTADAAIVRSPSFSRSSSSTTMIILPSRMASMASSTRANARFGRAAVFVRPGRGPAGTRRLMAARAARGRLPATGRSAGRRGQRTCR